MKIFKSKHYPKVMYLFLIVSILLILFSFVSILESVNDNIKQKSLTGFAIENLGELKPSINTGESKDFNSPNSPNPKKSKGFGDNETNQTINKPADSASTKDSSKKAEVNPEIYTTRPYIMFYLFLVGILVAIVLIFMILSNTVKKDIKIEEEERSSIFTKS